MRLAGLAILLLGLFGAVAAAQGGTRTRDGAVAPPNRWYVRGGCASRSGTSDARAPRRDPEAAWSYQVRGAIESEPLVWDDVVIIAAREAGGRRTLHLVDRESGRRLVQQPLPATVPLAPAVWGNRIVVRPAPDRVDVYRFDGRRLHNVRSIKTDGIVSEPLLFENELYLRVDYELFRYDLDRREHVWRARSTGSFRGSPALRGAYLFSVWYDPNQYPHVAALRRTDGRIVDDIVIGSAAEDLPAPDEEFAPVVLEDELIVALPRGVESQAGQTYSTVRVHRKREAFAKSPPPSLHHFLVEPTPFGPHEAGTGGWAVLEEPPGGVRQWITAWRGEHDWLQITMANSQRHPFLLDAPAASTAEDVLFLGPLAVEPRSLRVRWRAPLAPTFRPVPVEGGVVVVPRPDTATLLRPPALPLSPAATRAEAAIEKMDAELATRYATLAQQALRSRDVMLVRRLLTEAVSRGATGRALESAQDGLGRMLEDPRPAPPQPRLVTAIETEEAALIESERGELLRSAHDAGAGEFRHRILRALLERDAKDAATIAAIASFVPEDAPAAKEFDAASWLDFLEAHHANPLRFIAPPAGDPEGYEERRLAREVKSWRPDLSGYRTTDLCIVTPPGAPGAVASALSIGELVCDLLAEMFGGAGDAERDPLLLLLYESRTGYVEQSRRHQSEPEAARDWSAGHFDPVEGVSRMFIPETDEEYAQLLGTYAHELTHHWLDRRAPFPSGFPPETQPAFWVAEGFPSMVSEFRLDPRAKTWEPRNSRAHSLDIVANAKPDQLLPWDRVFAMSQEEFAALSAENEHPIPLSWHLGAVSKRSDIELFYAQAAAACHFLYQAENGARRAALLQYVRDWYEKRDEALDPQRAFGLSAQALGARAVAYARGVSGG